MTFTIFCFFALVLAKVEFKEQTDFYKASVPDVNLYSETGYISVESDKNQLFYHLFLQEGYSSLEDIKPNDQLLLYLNGGPGCASVEHSYQNVGPYIIDRVDGKIKILKGAHNWSKTAHLLFIDQPFNVGLSYSEILVSDSDTAAKYLSKALVEFFKSRTTLQQTQFYIFGLSYAGHYLPALGVQLLRTPEITNFKGVGYGNGWTDPQFQYGTFGSTLFNMGLITESRMRYVNSQMVIAQQNTIDETYNTFEGIYEIAPKYAGNVNVFNFQYYTPEGVAAEPYEEFINANLVQFGAKVAKYTTCSKIVGDNFAIDSMHSQKHNLEIILNEKRVLLYSGNLDVLCNTAGGTTWVNSLNWSGSYQWKQTVKSFWKSLNPATNQIETAGWLKKYQNFYYATVYRAGHMTPRNQPQATQKLIKAFLDGTL